MYRRTPSQDRLKGLFDLVLDNATIFSPQGDHDCIGISNGVISYVGNGRSNLDGKRRLDLDGASILPGFVDCHTHLLNLGLSILGLDLSGARSRDEAVELVKRRVRHGHERIVVGSGWDESSWGEKEYLGRNELDFTDVPIVLYRRDGHMAVLNTSALRMVGLPERRSGILKEGELRLLDELVEVDDEKRRMALRVALKKCLSEGITTVRDMVDMETYRVYKKLGKISIDVRMCVYHEDFDETMKADPQFWGVKLFLDGSIGAGTAAVKGWPGHNLLIKEEKLRAIVDGYRNKGISVAAHAIGDEATYLGARVLSSSGGVTMNSIEHFELATDQALDMMGSVVASCQPNFLQWSGSGGLYENRLGRFWAENNNAYRKILDRRIFLAFGSDCMPLGALYGIRLACNSRLSAQKISLEEAVNSYTLAGAKLLGIPRSGKLEAGYTADMVIIRGDPKRDAKIVATIKSGEVVYGKLPKGQ